MVNANKHAGKGQESRAEMFAYLAAAQPQRWNNQAQRFYIVFFLMTISLLRSPD